MLPIDYDIRTQILTQQGNIVISASAGTGKTHTTVLRIIYDAEKNNNYQTFAAITFTRKAAKEISNRLGPNRGDGFVGTNDNFVLTEVIQPFMYDAYGSEFKKNINPDYSNENRVYSFDEGINQIRDNGFMCKYDDNKKNFAFKLALEILENSHSTRRYLKSKYYRIYIDEYQDSDVDMHKFFMYLCDKLEIPLFIVGDEKQSIYGWRGAYSEGFTSLYEKPGFNKFELKHNFRSCDAIQNFSNIFMDSVRHYYKPITFQNEVILYKYSDMGEACDYIKEWIDENEKCAILNFRRDVAKVWSESLSGAGLDFIYIPDSPLDNTNMESEHIWIARGIANFILKHRYSEYDFRDEIPVPENFKVAILKNKLMEIKKNQEDFDDFKEQCYALYRFLGFNEESEKIDLEIETLYDVLTDEQYSLTYNQDKYIFTSGTIHSSKGLEFNQVIINASDYDFNRQDARYLHYVAVTRPEEKLLILADKGFHYDRYLGYISKAIGRTEELGFKILFDDVINIID